MYGTVYGMQKTTMYISDDLKLAVEQAADERRCSEAELIREALRILPQKMSPPRPRLPLFKSGKRRLAERVDAALAGFGQR